jgi:triacylglycerol lipase
MPKPLPADTWDNLYYPPPDYQYFENSNRFDFEPEAADFSWKNAWWLAEASLLAYVKKKPWDDVKAILAAADFSDAKQIGADPSKSTKGFIAWQTRNSPFAVVAFRGTDKDDSRNLETDLDTWPEQLDGYVVHRGFRRALDQVWDSEVVPTLQRFLAQHAGAPVYFTGHSLGAALATISVARFQGSMCALYTVGSPRVGDDRFVRTVLNKTKRVFRFVNCQDIVTQIPPEVPLEHYFRHVGSERYINRAGVILDHPSDFDKWLDATPGIVEHDGGAAVHDIAHPSTFISLAESRGAVPDPPPFLLGNHTPARYPIRIWNHYSGL